MVSAYQRLPAGFLLKNIEEHLNSNRLLILSPNWIGKDEGPDVLSG